MASRVSSARGCLAQSPTGLTTLFVPQALNIVDVSPGAEEPPHNDDCWAESGVYFFGELQGEQGLMGVSDARGAQ